MKKITLIALVLCLALTVFAFASCSKSNKGGDATAASTTAPTAAQTTTGESTTAHVHTPASEYTIDRQATCAAAGSKSYHCTVCGEIIPETVLSIDKLDHTPEPTITVLEKATCNSTGLQAYICLECGETIDSTIEVIPIDPKAHKITEWTVTEPVNMFHVSGHREGYCPLCEQTIGEDITFEPTIEAFTASSGQYNTEKAYYADVRGDKHFYPTESDPEGNDLLVEFSILWNETVLDFDPAGNDYMCGRFDKNGPFYYFSPVVGCPTSDAAVAGAFEWMGNFTTPISDSEVTTKPTMCGKSSNYDDYPNINGADPDHPEYGWHRIGVRYHFELLDGKTGAELSDYRGTVTVYLDGTAIYKLSTGDKGMQDKEAHLFNAVRDGDTVTYSDVDSFVIPFQINRAQAMSDKTVYLALADISVTCGKSFVMPVEKVASPEAATLTVADGVDVPAPIYFKLAD